MIYVMMHIGKQPKHYNSVCCEESHWRIIQFDSEVIVLLVLPKWLTLVVIGIWNEFK